MSNLDPKQYKNGQPVTASGNPDPLRVNEAVSSASPKVELGKSKAVVAAVAGGVVAAGGVFITALTDGAIDLGEAYAIIGAGLAGAGLPGFAAFLAPTTVTRKR